MDNPQAPQHTEPQDLTGGEDPYQFQNNDITGLSLVSEVLQGRENFVTWKRSMEIALSARSKLRFVLGVHPRPTDLAGSIKWQRCNDLIMSWINASVSKQVLSQILMADDVIAAWKILDTRYSGSTLTRVYGLRQTICNFNQGSLDVATYYEKLSGYWQQLDAALALKGHNILSTCNACKLNAKHNQEERTMKFIMGLNDSHDHIRTHLLALAELPSIDSVFDRVSQDETKLSLIKAPVPEYSALYANQHNPADHNKQSYSKPRPNITCTYCKQPGHTKDYCYKLHGYPPNHRSYKPPVNPPNSTNTRRPPPIRPSAHCSITTELPDSTPSMPQLSSQQITQLLALLKDDTNVPSTNVTHMAGTCNSLHSIFESDIWIFDSGATDHFAHSTNSLFDVCKLPKPYSVHLPNGNVSHVTHSGKAKLQNGLTLYNVLLVPEFRINLISIGKLLSDEHCSVTFLPNECYVQDQAMKTTLETGKFHRGLYVVKASKLPQAFSAVSAQTSSMHPGIWHQRLGHASNVSIQQLLQQTNEGTLGQASINHQCFVCPMAKHTKLPFPVKTPRTTQLFDLIMADVWGPFSTTTISGASYFLTLIDDYSRNCWTFLMKHKSEVTDLVINFYNIIHTQFGVLIKIFRSDNGKEFSNLKLQQFFNKHGCLQQFSCPYTPEQNGIVERKHRHLLEMARALRFNSNIPKKFWGDCVLTATYLINRLPTKVLSGKSPFEVLFGAPPPISHLRVFGCLCFVISTAQNKDKLDPRGIPCLFLGYPYGHKGYKLYNLQTNKILISRHVRFFEQVFPYQQLPITTTSTHHQPFIHTQILPNSDDQFSDDHLFADTPDPNSTSSLQLSPSPTNSTQPASDSSIPHSNPNTNEPLTTSPSTAIEEIITQPTSPSTAIEMNLSQPPPLPRRSNRHITQPAWQTDFICQKLSKQKNSNTHSISNYVSYSNCSSPHSAYLASLDSLSEPTSYTKAKSFPHWCEAMQREISALEVNNTWSISDLPQGKTPIKCKWIYKVKLKSDGSLERYKARLVAKGFTQIEDIDYHETFAPVAKMPTIRCLLAVAAKKHWIIHQLDVNNAFLNGDLDEEIYMHLPSGFYATEKAKGKVCRLLKSLYGLKQSCRQWFSKFSDALLLFGFSQSLLDYSLFIYRRGNHTVLLLVYVDDILITGSCPSLIAEIKTFIHSQFQTKDLGHLKYFLGLEIARSNSGIFLNQRKYTMDILSTAGLTDCKPVKSPMDQKHKLILSGAPPLPDPTPYRQLIGKLIYLSITRPDIAYAVHILSQFLKNPTAEHMEATYHLLRYLKNAPAQGLFFPANSDFTLRIYCDADWAACPLSRRSITGHCTLLGGALLSWTTRKQTVVARSSAESEYRAMASASSDAVWFEAILREMGAPTPRPVSLYCDNTAAIQIAKNPVHHQRTKHIEVDIHFIRHHVRSGLLRLEHVPSALQAADLLTKPLPIDQIRRLLFKLNVCNFLHNTA